MKAGIYKTPNGNLIYVAKDRTIKATTVGVGWLGTKVSHRAKDDTVLIAGTDYRCTRFADVPNGCNDFDKALADAFVDTFVAPPLPSGHAPTGDEVFEASKYKDGGVR